MERKQIPLFEGVPEDIIEELLNDRLNARKAYKAGEYVVFQGAPCRSLYLLTAGKLDTTMTNAEGKELTIEKMSAPEILAPAFLFGKVNRFPVNIIARTDCQLCIINKRSFLQFMHEHPSVMENFIAQISNRCVFLSRKLNEFALQNLHDRVINYLKKYGNITNQQETASRLGVARPSLARILSELLKENVIKKGENGIVLTEKPHTSLS